MISKPELQKIINQFKMDSEELGKIIYPVMEKYNLEKKEVLELCQVGQFIYRVDSKFKIVEKPQPPSPDFIIEHNSNLIGLEHTRLLTENAQKYFKVNSIIDYAQETYKSKFPDDKVHAIISIKNDAFDYKQHQKAEIGNLISQAVYDTKHKVSCILPSFISNLRITG